MDHTPAAQRRLKAIHAHLTATADESPSHLLNEEEEEAQRRRASNEEEDARRRSRKKKK